MPDITLTTGADTSGVARGLAQLRNEVSRTGEEVKASFVSGFGAAAIASALSLEALKQVIDRAHEIHHESERFGIDAEQLQLIANAAGVSGISLEQTARAMNFLAKGGNEASSALQTLGIDTQAWIQMDAAQRFFAVADAMHQSGLNAGTYAAAAKLLGSRFGTELIPVLMQGSQAIKDQGAAMGVFSNDSIASLERFHEVWKTVGNFISVFFGQTLAIGINGVRSAWAGLQAADASLRDSIVMDWKIIGRAMHFDWEGVKREFAAGSAALAKDDKNLRGAIQRIWHPDKGELFGEDNRMTEYPEGTLEGGSGSGRGGGEGTGGAGGSSEDRLAQAYEEHYKRSLPDAEKLKEIDRQRGDLQQQLNDLAAKGGGEIGEEAKIREQMLKLDEESESTQKRINDDQEAYNKSVEAEVKDAEDKTANLERQNRLYELQRSLGADLGLATYNQEQTAEKIASITDRINRAWTDGKQTLAEQLTEMRDQLEVQKQIDDRAVSRARAERIKSFSIPSGLSSFDLSGLPKTQALLSQLGGGSAFGLNYAIAHAMDQQGNASDEDVARYLAEYFVKTNGGQRNLGFLDQAFVDRTFETLGARQGADAIAAQNAQQSSALQLARLVTSQGSAAFDTGPLADLLARILAQLRDTHGKITPPPG
jgi:hypothetical protein